jgi:tetratricopeptide (TPR) repeat protein
MPVQTTEVRIRAKVFKELVAALQGGKIVNLVGGAGVGKSFLAEAFVKTWMEQTNEHQKQRCYFWVRAHNATSARNGLVDILKQVNDDHVPGAFKNVETKQLAELVLKALEEMRSKEWLLVVDDVPHLEFGFEKMFDSPLSAGRILLTTRDTIGVDTKRDSVKRIKIDPLTATEAESLFLKKIPCRSGETMRATRELVAKHFEGLPLAIVTSSSVIISSGITVTRYRNMLSSLKTPSGTGAKIHAILDCIFDFACWLGLENLLSVVVWLNHKLIERQLLPADDAAIARLRALNVLRKCSLADQEATCFSIPRIFQIVARKRCTSPMAAIMAIRKNGLEAFSREDRETWGPAMQMLPHVESILFSYQRNEIVRDDDNVACADLFNKGGHVALWASAEYATALELHEATRDLLQNRSSQDNENRDRMAATMKDIGRVHQAQENYSVARDVYTEALALMRADNEHASSLMIATTLHNLGRVCVCLEQHHEARQHVQAALQMKKDLNASPASIALTAANFGTIHQLTGRDEEAGTQYLNIGRMSGVDDHSIFGATTYLRKGQVLQRLGDIESARRSYEQALEKYLQNYSITAENDTIAVAHTYLGSVLMEFGDFIGAHLHLNMALYMLKKVHGASTNHENIANVLVHLSSLYRKGGDHQNAEIKRNEATVMINGLMAQKASAQRFH